MICNSLLRSLKKFFALTVHMLILGKNAIKFHCVLIAMLSAR